MKLTYESNGKYRYFYTQEEYDAYKNDKKPTAYAEAVKTNITHF